MILTIQVVFGPQDRAILERIAQALEDHAGIAQATAKLKTAADQLKQSVHQQQTPTKGD